MRSVGESGNVKSLRLGGGRCRACGNVVMRKVDKFALKKKADAERMEMWIGRGATLMHVQRMRGRGGYVGRAQSVWKCGKFVLWRGRMQRIWIDLQLDVEMWNA